MVSFDNASMPYKMVTANGFEMADFIRAVTKEALPGGGGGGGRVAPPTF